MTQQLDPDQPAAEPSAGRTVMAEWALWGKEANEPGYRVLRCSSGTFGPDDFHGVITRYASGAKETLPQYTICWIPDENGHEGYLAVGIHELASADPRRSGGRVRTARGREIEYLRLFCVRYSSLAEHGASYTELVEAVCEYQLPVGSTDLIPIELGETEPPTFAAPTRALAENVATLLLTTCPVCVLGGERATAEERLRFIDEVMSLLPYGLRTTLSASTWASATAQELKLRLFFTSVRRDDGGRTHYLIWGQPRRFGLAGPEQLPLRHYRSWLGHVGSGAAAALADQRAPVRFNPAEIRQMVANLPEGRPVKDILEELADGLRRKNTSDVRQAINRLKHQRGSPAGPADRQAYQQTIKRLGLFGAHPWLHSGTRASLYRALLRLAFRIPISYASYCEIEDCVGSPPHGALRHVMLGFRFSGFMPWLLTSMKEDEFTGQALRANLYQQGVPVTGPVDEFVRDIAIVRPWHRGLAYDFAVGYVRAYAEDPGQEFIRRGYFAQILEDTFPRDVRAQRIRLEETLRLVYGGPLSDDQLSELYDQPGLRPTAALTAAIAHLESSKAGTRDTIWASWKRNRISRAAAVKAGVAVLGAGAIAVVVILILLHAVHP